MKRIIRSIFVMAAAAMLLFVPARAHDGGNHVKGTVTSITADTITLKSTEGASMSVHYDPTTKFEKSKAAATVKDLMVGDRVVIDFEEMYGTHHATWVRFGAQPKASARSGDGGQIGRASCRERV